MAILIIAEHANSSLAPATLSVVTAAKLLSEDLHILVAGVDCAGAANEAAQVAGVTKVLVADNPTFAHMLAENMAPLVTEIADGYSHIFAAATTNGKNVLPRAAALLDVSMISDVVSVESANTFKRPIYAGNAIATVESSDSLILATVRTTAFDSAGPSNSTAAIEALTFNADSGMSAFEKEVKAESDRPELTAANIVISGGRGVGSAENFALLYTLADKLGAAVGASRAAVDAGYVPNDLQVGQTGKIVAPDLYIAVGISGAIQHMAGMKESKVIVAINSDAEAPIFQTADYGLVANLFDAVPELERLLSA